MYCYTWCLKNALTLASCSFNKHGLILIILGKQHQHTSKMIRVQYSLFLHFYLLYLLLNKWGGNDARYDVFSSLDCCWLWIQTVLV